MAALIERRRYYGNVRQKSIDATGEMDGGGLDWNRSVQRREREREHVSFELSMME
jgi:hypothetical protein